MAASMRLATGEDLGRAVLYRLKEKADLQIMDLRVQAEGAIVTLEGSVDNREKRRLAEAVVMAVSGVKAVANDITIKRATEREDAEIARNALSGFQSNRSLRAEQVQVSVSCGRITLEGRVPTGYERLLAEAIAKNLRGISGVQNNLLIEPQAFL